jgi:hypothetical protein
MKITIYYTIIACCTCLLLASCSNKESTIIKAPSLDAAALTNTRAAKKKVAAEAYYYRTLASFVNGSVTISDMDKYAPVVEEVNLVVLYEATAPWAELLEAGLPQATGNSHLNGLIESYQLEIIKQFSIDQNNKGLVLQAAESLNDPIETARRLSLIEHVLMVNIKEVPAYEALSVKHEDK